MLYIYNIVKTYNIIYYIYIIYLAIILGMYLFSTSIIKFNKESILRDKSSHLTYGEIQSDKLMKILQCRNIWLFLK